MNPKADMRPEEIVELYYRDVFGAAYRFTGNEVDASDLTQETFKNVLGVLAGGGKIEHPKAYLMTAMKNQFFRGIRHRHQEESYDNIEDFIEEHQTDEINAAPDQIDGDDIQSVINQLEENFRLPLVMFYYNEMSYDEIAHILEIPIGTVMSRLSRAKRFIKLKLGTLGNK